MSVPQALKIFDELPDSALVGSRVAKGLDGDCSDMTLWRKIRAGKFPPPDRPDNPRKWYAGTLRKYLRGEWAPTAEPGKQDISAGEYTS